MVNTVPPGALGLTLQPFWSPGSARAWAGGQGRGYWFWRRSYPRAPVSLNPGRPGLCAARGGRADLQAQRNPDHRNPRGWRGSQSDSAMQLTADIFGVPTTRPHLYEASGLGAAIDAAVGLGLHPNFQTAISEMTHRASHLSPTRSTTASMTSSTSRFTCGCTNVSARCTSPSAISPAIRPGPDRAEPSCHHCVRHTYPVASRLIHPHGQQQRPAVDQAEGRVSILAVVKGQVQRNIAPGLNLHEEDHLFLFAKRVGDSFDPLPDD